MPQTGGVLAGPCPGSEPGGTGSCDREDPRASMGAGRPLRVKTPGLGNHHRRALHEGVPMIEKLLAAATSGVVAAAMLTFVAPPAHSDEVASGVVLRDGPGDVWTGLSPDREPTRADFPAADVTRVLVRHAPFAIRIRMRFVD